jgi:hypothetical protein
MNDQTEDDIKVLKLIAERLRWSGGRRWRRGRPEGGAGTTGGTANVTRRRGWLEAAGAGAEG